VGGGELPRPPASSPLSLPFFQAQKKRAWLKDGRRIADDDGVLVINCSLFYLFFSLFFFFFFLLFLCDGMKNVVGHTQHIGASTTGFPFPFFFFFFFSEEMKVIEALPGLCQTLVRLARRLA